MLTIQTTISPNIISIFIDGEFMGEIEHNSVGYTSKCTNGLKGVFSSLEAAKKLFLGVEDKAKTNINNQIKLF